jgi:hypothetical protein
MSFNYKATGSLSFKASRVPDSEGFFRELLRKAGCSYLNSRPEINKTICEKLKEEALKNKGEMDLNDIQYGVVFSTDYSMQDKIYLCCNCFIDHNRERIHVKFDMNQDCKISKESPIQLTKEEEIFFSI